MACDDPVFGTMREWNLSSLFDSAKTALIRGEIADACGVVLVYGTGAAYVAGRWDLLLLLRCDAMGRFNSASARTEPGTSEPPMPPRLPPSYTSARIFVDWRAADAESTACIPPSISTSTPTSPNARR